MNNYYELLCFYFIYFLFSSLFPMFIFVLLKFIVVNILTYFFFILLVMQDNFNLDFVFLIIFGLF